MKRTIKVENKLYQKTLAFGNRNVRTIVTNIRKELLKYACRGKIVY